MGRIAEEIVDDAPTIGTRSRETAPVVDDPERGGIDAAAGEFADQSGDLSQIAGLPAVVGIEKSDVFALRRSHAPVAGDAHPGVGLPDETHQPAALRSGHVFDNGSAPVGRPVVHDDDLHGRHTLRQHRTQRRSDFVGLIIQGYHHRNGGKILKRRHGVAKIPIFCYFCK